MCLLLLLLFCSGEQHGPEGELIECKGNGNCNTATGQCACFADFDGSGGVLLNVVDGLVVCFVLFIVVVVG